MYISFLKFLPSPQSGANSMESGFKYHSVGEKNSSVALSLELGANPSWQALVYTHCPCLK